MIEALDGFEGTVTGGGSLNNPRFADDIDLLAGKPDELSILTR